MRDTSLQPEHFLRDRVVSTEALVTESSGGFQTRHYKEYSTQVGNTGMTGTETGPTVECSSGGDTVRFCSAGSLLTISAHPPTRDLSGFNQLSAILINRTNGSLLVGMKLVHGSESFSSGTPDVSLSGGREQLSPGAWTDLKFPTESFGSYGVPDGWRDIRDIELSFSRERTYEGTEPVDVEISSLNGEFREIPPGPRLTLEGLAQVLNPDIPHFAELLTKKQSFAQSIIHLWSPGPPFVADNSGLLIPPPHPYPRERADDILPRTNHGADGRLSVCLGRLSAWHLGMVSLPPSSPFHKRNNRGPG